MVACVVLLVSRFRVAASTSVLLYRGGFGGAMRPDGAVALSALGPLDLSMILVVALFCSRLRRGKGTLGSWSWDSISRPWSLYLCSLPFVL